MLTIVSIIIPFIIPNSDNFGASSSEIAVAAPPWLTSESEEPLTHKLEVHACIMAMEHVYLREVNAYQINVRNY